jgi:sugar (pentulose or hexulose) kinase
VFDLHVQAGGDADASARGAAILARIATGAATWDEALNEASDIATEPGAIATPNTTQSARYRERASRFHRLAEALNGGR